jgi:putative ABC transport system permease protein
VVRGYLEALGIPILAGRDFTDHDVRAGAGAIVSAAMASQLWPDGSALGRSFRDGRDGRRVEVIGIAGDVTLPIMRNRQPLEFYRPLNDEDLAGRLTFVLRTAGDPRSAVAAARQQLQALDANLPAYVQTMAQRMEVPMWPWRTAVGFLLVCGTLALVLATVGLFGVTYYAVSQRTREFGVRVALGATRPRVMALVLGEGVRLAIPGVVVGAAAAFAAARLLSSMLVDVSPGDPLTYGATVALQIAVALAACALPAFRATRVDPMVALRSE